MDLNRIKNNPYVLMAIILVMWGSFTAISKLLLRNVDSFQVQFYIFGIAAVIMTVNMALKGNFKKFRELKRKDFIFLFLCALLSFLYYFMYILALKLIPAVEASMLNYLFPVMIVIFAIPINGEKLNRLKVFSLVLGFIGMAFIITNGRLIGMSFSNLPGDLLAIGGAVCWSIFSNLGKRNKIDQSLSNYVYIMISFVLSFVCMITFSNFIIPGVGVFAGLFWISISNILIAYYLWLKVLKITSSAMVASLSFVTPFVTLVFIMILLGEKISAIQIFGLILILAGIGILNFRDIFGKIFSISKT